MQSVTGCRKTPQIGKKRMESTEYRSTKGRAWVLPLAAGALSATWLFLVPAAEAQNQTRSEVPSRPPIGQSASPTISDEKLDAAAAAIENVTAIRESYEQQLAAAAPPDKERIAGEANTALKKAVTDKGISLEEFNAVIDAAQDDPTVRKQLVQRIHPSHQ
jgi:hypothetical protein